MNGARFAYVPRMPIVHCDQKMWRMVRGWNLFSDPSPGSDAGVLGDWAATVMQEEQPALMVLVNIKTCLVTVFPACPASTFVRSFKAELQSALEDLCVNASAIASETKLLEGLTLKRMPRTEFSDVIDDVKFVCGIELMYHADLRRVQSNLNEFPHAIGTAAEVVSGLFQRGTRHLSHWQ